MMHGGRWDARHTFVRCFCQGTVVCNPGKHHLLPNLISRFCTGCSCEFLIFQIIKQLLPLRVGCIQCRQLPWDDQVGIFYNTTVLGGRLRNAHQRPPYRIVVVGHRIIQLRSNARRHLFGFRVEFGTDKRFVDCLSFVPVHFQLGGLPQSASCPKLVGSNMEVVIRRIDLADLHSKCMFRLLSAMLRDVELQQVTTCHQHSSDPAVRAYVPGNEVCGITWAKKGIQGAPRKQLLTCEGRREKGNKTYASSNVCSYKMFGSELQARTPSFGGAVSVAFGCGTFSNKPALSFEYSYSALEVASISSGEAVSLLATVRNSSTTCDDKANAAALCAATSAAGDFGLVYVHLGATGNFDPKGPPSFSPTCRINAEFKCA